MELLKTLFWTAGFNAALYGGIIGLLALFINPFLGIAIFALVIIIATFL
ncbi:MAG: hypothetical protein M1147_00470 [Nitrospirae bacterium]|nr:hypothetical protein [Nitrospirota bacterium]